MDCCPEPLLLSIETATPCSSVALTRGDRRTGTVIASLDMGGNVSHSRRLLSIISQLMEESFLDWHLIDGICVGLGPGSFTGLRIGMATAKGLAVAAEKPLFGVSVLDGLASKCCTDRLICAVVDARKKEVYTSLYRCSDKGLSERVSEIVVVKPDRLAGGIEEPVLMVGDGVRAYGDIFRTLLAEEVIFAPAQLHVPSAVSIGLLGAEMFVAGDELDVVEAVPLYVRSSDAELNLLQKKKKNAAGKEVAGR